MHYLSQCFAKKSLLTFKAPRCTNDMKHEHIIFVLSVCGKVILYKHITSIAAYTCSPHALGLEPSTSQKILKCRFWHWLCTACTCPHKTQTIPIDFLN